LHDTNMHLHLCGLKHRWLASTQSLKLSLYGCFDSHKLKIYCFVERYIICVGVQLGSSREMNSCNVINIEEKEQWS